MWGVTWLDHFNIIAWRFYTPFLNLMKICNKILLWMSIFLKAEILWKLLDVRGMDFTRTLSSTCSKCPKYCFNLRKTVIETNLTNPHFKIGFIFPPIPPIWTFFISAPVSQPLHICPHFTCVTHRNLMWFPLRRNMTSIRSLKIFAETPSCRLCFIILLLQQHRSSIGSDLIKVIKAHTVRCNKALVKQHNPTSVRFQQNRPRF